MHEALHVHPAFEPLTRKNISVDEFVRAVRALEYFYRTAEAQRRVVLPPVLPDFPAAALLAKELRRLGAAPIASLNVPDVPVIADASQNAGYLYVKQGSTLGGRVISKNVAAAGIYRESGKSSEYFNGYGKDTAIQWKIFVAYLGNPAIHFDENNVVVTANDSFNYLRRVCDAVMEHKE